MESESTTRQQRISRWEIVRDVHLAEEHAEDGEGAEEDDEDVGDEGEKTRPAERAVVVHQAPAHEQHRGPPHLHPPLCRWRLVGHRRPFSLQHRRPNPNPSRRSPEEIAGAALDCTQRGRPSKGKYDEHPHTHLPYRWSRLWPLSVDPALVTNETYRRMIWRKEAKGQEGKDNQQSFGSDPNIRSDPAFWQNYP